MVRLRIEFGSGRFKDKFHLELLKPPWGKIRTVLTISWYSSEWIEIFILDRSSPVLFNQILAL